MNNIKWYIGFFCNIAPPRADIVKRQRFVIKRAGRIDYDKIRKTFFGKCLCIRIAVIISGILCRGIAAVFVFRRVCPYILCVKTYRYRIIRHMNNIAYRREFIFHAVIKPVLIADTRAVLHIFVINGIGV